MLGVFTLAFIVANMWLYYEKGGIPDSLVVAVMGMVSVEGMLLAKITVAKVNKEKEEAVSYNSSTVGERGDVE